MVVIPILQSLYGKRLKYYVWQSLYYWKIQRLLILVEKLIKFSIQYYQSYITKMFIDENNNESNANIYDLIFTIISKKIQL
jgi:hypothetical protein